MGHRLSRLYTRTGDQGSTGLADGSRVAKTDSRVEAMGDVDELNGCIALVLAEPVPERVHQCLIQVQHVLFDLGGELSMPGTELIDAEDVTRLEAQVDELNQPLPPLKEFILPGGGRAAAACHLARCVCRRAERRVVALAAEAEVGPSLLAYLNRLSDLLFAVGRVLAREAGEGEVYWQKRHRRPE